MRVERQSIGKRHYLRLDMSSLLIRVEVNSSRQTTTVATAQKAGAKEHEQGEPHDTTDSPACQKSLTSRSTPSTAYSEHTYYSAYIRPSWS